MSRRQLGNSNGNWKGGRIKVKDCIMVRIKERGYVAEHILFAEEVLGKRLPIGVVVHHADGNCFNNEKSNLVICQDQGYHQTLHRRKRAFDVCGQTNWRKCKICGNYDDPINLKFRPATRNGHHIFHKECEILYDKMKYRRKKMLAEIETEAP